MIATQLFVTSLVVAASATSLDAREDAYFVSLLKRQEPGTPAYNCHDNCGSAITLSRGTDPCSNATFVSEYNNCLKCSGPDNYNIWRYYGGTLSGAGSKCGFDTEPLSGKQEDVPEAGDTGVASSGAPTQASSALFFSSATAPSSSQAATITEVATSEAPISSALVSSTFVANRTLSSSVSGTPSTSTIASSSFTTSSPAEVTANVATSLRVADAAGVFGAIFVGVLFGI